MKSKALIAFVIALAPIILASHAFAQDSCFPHGLAYLEWQSVVREQPALWGRAISLDQVGFRFVQDSKRFAGNCWAQVPSDVGRWRFGWLLAENLTAVRIPSIYGDELFTAQINDGLEYLASKAPRWLLYVTQYEYRIEPTKPGETTSKAEWPAKIVRIHEDAFVSEQELATHLVHEACHIHQFEDGRFPLSEVVTHGVVRMEQECIAREVEMLMDIAPEHELVQERRNLLGKAFGWWVNGGMSFSVVASPVGTS